MKVKFKSSGTIGCYYNKDLIIKVADEEIKDIEHRWAMHLISLGIAKEYKEVLKQENKNNKKSKRNKNNIVNKKQYSKKDYK